MEYDVFPKNWNKGFSRIFVIKPRDLENTNIEIPKTIGPRNFRVFVTSLWNIYNEQIINNKVSVSCEELNDNLEKE